MNSLVRVAVAAIAAASFTYAASAQLPGGSTPASDTYAQTHHEALAACHHLRGWAIQKGESAYINCMAQADPQRYIHCRELQLEYGNIDFHMWHHNMVLVGRCMVSERWRNLHLADAAALDNGKLPQRVKR